MGRLLVVGSANVDLVMRVPRFPAPGETVLSLGSAQFVGGKGANQAGAAAKFGAEVAFCACVGADALGELVRAELNALGVNLRFLKAVPELPTGTAQIWVSPSGENQIVVGSGANEKLSSEHVRQAIAEFQPDWILTQLEIPAEAVEACLDSGVPTLLNPAPFRPVEASRAWAVTPNETEAAQMGAGHPRLLVTMGAVGVRWGDRLFPAPKVKPVDTTGAGDVFNGVLAAELSQGRTLEEAIGTAVWAASLSVTRASALKSAPTRQEVESFRV